MFLHITLDTLTIEINHTTGNKEWCTIDDILLIYWFHHKVWSTEIHNSYIAKYQRQQQYHPSPLFIIQQEGKERKKHIKRKYRTKEPSHTYHLNIWIRQEIKAHRQVCKALTESTQGWFHHKANHHHHGKEWPGTMIALSIELRRSYCSRLYTFIISTAHTECTNNHKQQCEIREPRNHTTSQDIITWLNHKISLNVHKHDTYCCVSTQTIQRRVIFSDIRRCGGGVSILLLIYLFLFLSSKISTNIFEECLLVSLSLY